MKAKNEKKRVVKDPLCIVLLEHPVQGASEKGVLFNNNRAFFVQKQRVADGQMDVTIFKRS